MKLIDYIDSRREQNLTELKEFLRIPSVSTKSEHKPDIERAAQWVADKLRAAGLEKIEIVPTKMHPLVYGESMNAPGSQPFSFTATTMCSPPSRSTCGPARPSNLPYATGIFLAAAPL